MRVEKGLVIDLPWIEYILSGKKIWEMRSSNTNFRGPFALIQKGSKMVFGIANLTNVLNPMDIAQLEANFDKHQVPNGKFFDNSGRLKWNVPWVLGQVQRLENPLPYTHKSGAVTWVKLDEDLQVKLGAFCKNGHSPIESNPSARDQMVISQDRKAKSDHSISTKFDENKGTLIETSSIDPNAGAEKPKLIGETTLSGGNIRNNHFYLRSFFDKFPNEIIGGSNKGSVASQNAFIDWGDEFLAETDIDSDKKFFRKRGWIKSFFEKNKAQEGDLVQIFELSDRVYQVAIKK